MPFYREKEPLAIEVIEGEAQEKWYNSLKA